MMLMLTTEQCCWYFGILEWLSMHGAEYVCVCVGGISVAESVSVDFSG